LPVKLSSLHSIRKIKKEDNAELADMIRSVFREYGVVRPNTVYDDPTTDELSELFMRERSALFILENENKIVGSAGIYPTPGLPDNCCELVKFYISPWSRGKGYGKMLMEKCFEAAKDVGYENMYLESFPEFMTALGLYKKAGFEMLPAPMGNSGHTGCQVWMIKQL
jgi:putative acetyltransferase